MFQSIAFYIGEKTLDLNGQGYLEHPEGYGGDDFFWAPAVGRIS